MLFEFVAGDKESNEAPQKQDEEQTDQKQSTATPVAGTSENDEGTYTYILHGDVLAFHCLATKLNIKPAEGWWCQWGGAMEYKIVIQPDMGGTRPASSIPPMSGGTTITCIIHADQRIELVNKVGEGTFGVVFKAVYRGKHVAAKVVKCEKGTKTYRMIIKESETIRYYTCMKMCKLKH